MLKALIVDDEELARRGLELRLEKYPDVSVCGMSCNGREALADVKEHAPAPAEAGRVRPPSPNDQELRVIAA